MSKNLKRNCQGCRAILYDPELKVCKCMLGHEMIMLDQSHSPRDPSNWRLRDHHLNCEKPRSHTAVKQLLFPDYREEVVKVGDILYRPCVSYHGKTNFVNPSIVRKIVEKRGVTYAVSYDMFRQSWADRVEDIGSTVFKTRRSAENRLKEKSNELKTQ